MAPGPLCHVFSSMVPCLMAPLSCLSCAPTHHRGKRFKGDWTFAARREVSTRRLSSASSCSFRAVSTCSQRRQSVYSPVLLCHCLCSPNHFLPLICRRTGTGQVEHGSMVVIGWGELLWRHPPVRHRILEAMWFSHSLRTSPETGRFPWHRTPKACVLHFTVQYSTCFSLDRLSTNSVRADRVSARRPTS